jgi:hypothetical protein
VGVKRNDDIHHRRLVATSPMATWHLVLMLKKAAGGDMSAHARGCRSLMWALVKRNDVVHHRHVVATWHLFLVLKTEEEGMRVLTLAVVGRS